MRTLKEIVRREIDHSELQKLLQPRKTGGKRVCLQHLIIKKYNFSGLTLRNTEIYNSILKRCQFRNACLSHVLLGELVAVFLDCRSVTIESGDILWSDLRQARFDGANLERIYFFNTDLSSVSFRNANLLGANFVQCNCCFTDFTGARLDATQFIGCKLNGAIGIEQQVLRYEPVMFSEKTW